MRNTARTASRPRIIRSAALASTLVVALSVTACSSGGGSGSSADAPIKVAQITTQSGGYPFGDTVKGTQSYINMLNANGGIDGHQIEFQSGDDKGDSGEAAQLARKFVQQDQVVGFVGNTSLVDCQVNKAFYEANNIPVVGGGTQTDCFLQKNWTPVNAGPYVGHEVMWKYIYEVIKPTTVCGIEQNDPTSVPYYNQLIADFESANNVKFKYVTYTNDASQDPTPAVTNAKSQGCDMIFMSTVAPNFAAYVTAAKSVGLDATFIDAGSGYDTSLPTTLGATGEPGALGPNSKGVFVAAELAPTDTDVPGVTEMNDQFAKDGVTANFWSEIGWLSAKVFFEGLKQGAASNDVTTAKGALAALQAMTEVDTGFAATPLTFGPGDTHSPNLGSKVLQVSGGGFVLGPDQPNGWTVVDALPAPNN